MDKHRTRRLILDAVLDLDPAPATLDDLAGYPPVSMAALERSTLVEEARGLARHGYLTDLRPGREPLYRITAAGQDQARRESGLDEYIWGEFATFGG